MVYGALDVARYIINYSNKKDYGISNLKLQKILYFVQAYFLMLTDSICFSDRIEAWDFGPVVPVVYHEYKAFGASDIPTIRSYVILNKENIWKSEVREFDEDVIHRKDKKMIQEVVDNFADYPASALVEITHNQDPWKDAHKYGKNNEITPDAIRKYFNENESDRTSS